jgi:hypothetical protein
MAATIANINIKAFLDTTGIFIGAKKAEKGITAFATSLGDKLGITTALANPATAAVAAIGTAAAVSAYQVNEAFKRVANIKDLSERFDISTDSLQKLGIAAKLSATDFDTLVKGVQKMALTVGTGGMSLDKRFAQMADQIASIEDPGLRAARATEVFGKAGLELQNLLMKGSKDIALAGSIVDDFGLGLTQFDTEQIARANDAWDKMAFVLEGVWNKVAAQLAPVLANTIELMLDGLKDVGTILSSQGITWEQVGSVARMALNGVIGGVRTSLMFLEGVYLVVLKIESGFLRAAEAASKLSGSVKWSGWFGEKAEKTIAAAKELEKSIANHGRKGLSAFLDLNPMGEAGGAGRGFGDAAEITKGNAPLALRNSIEAMKIISGSRSGDYEKDTAKNTRRMREILEEILRTNKTKSATPAVAMTF